MIAQTLLVHGAWIQTGARDDALFLSDGELAGRFTRADRVAVAAHFTDETSKAGFDTEQTTSATAAGERGLLSHALIDDTMLISPPFAIENMQLARMVDGLTESIADVTERG